MNYIIPQVTEAIVQDANLVKDAIIKAYQENKSVYLPDKIYEIREPLIFDSINHVNIITDGKKVNLWGPMYNGGVVFMWAGTAKNVPMIEMRHCVGWNVDPIFLQGRNLWGSTGNVDTLLHMTNPDRKGCGTHTFKWLGLRDAKSLIKFGNEGEWNCDLSVFNQIEMTGGDYGLITIADQALLHVVDWYYAVGIKVPFAATKGGSFKVKSGHQTKCGTIFEGGLGGPNAMVNLFQGIRTEEQEKWFSNPNGSHLLNVIFSDCEQAAPVDTNNSLLDVKSGANVTLRDCSIRSKLGTLNGNLNSPAILNIDGGRYWQTPSVIKQNYYTFDRGVCYDDTGKKFSEVTEKKTV